VKISPDAVKAARRGVPAALGPAYNRLMADVAFVLIIIAFFAFATLFVAFCDRVIGTDEEAFADAPEYANVDEERAAA